MRSSRTRINLFFFPLLGAVLLLMMLFGNEALAAGCAERIPAADKREYNIDYTRICELGNCIYNRDTKVCEEGFETADRIQEDEVCQMQIVEARRAFCAQGIDINNDCTEQCLADPSLNCRLISGKCRAKPAALAAQEREQQREDVLRQQCDNTIVQQRAECNELLNDENKDFRDDPECLRLLNQCLQQGRANFENDAGSSEGDGGTTSKEECESIASDGHNDCNNLAGDEQAQECIEVKYNECLTACLDCAGANPTRQAPAGYDGPIPSCAFTYEGCRDVSDFLQLIVNIGKAIFGIIGTMAFIMLVYGGFVIMTAMGEAEKFKKGFQIIFAAIVGLLIAFTSYIMIDLLLEAFAVKEGFRGIK